MLLTFCYIGFLNPIGHCQLVVCLWPYVRWLFVTLHIVDVRLTCLINITYLLTYLLSAFCQRPESPNSVTLTTGYSVSVVTRYRMTTAELRIRRRFRPFFRHLRRRLARPYLPTDAAKTRSLTSIGRHVTRRPRPLGSRRRPRGGAGSGEGIRSRRRS